MEKTDFINIRIRPDLKQAFVSEFDGYKMAVAFEMLYMKHVDMLIEQNGKAYSKHVEIYDAMKKDPNSMPEAIAIVKKNCGDLIDAREKYEALREKAFPQFYGTGDLGLN